MFAQGSPRSWRLCWALVAWLGLAGCAAARGPGPRPRRLAEIVAPAPVWEETAEALETMLRGPSGDIPVAFGEENRRCSLRTQGGVALACGDETMAADSIEDLVRRINAGELHRVVARGSLFDRDAAVAAFRGLPPGDPEAIGPWRWRRWFGDALDWVELQVGERGEITASFRGLDGPEQEQASSARALWRALARRAEEISRERILRAQMIRGQTILGALFATLDVRRKTFRDIELGASYKEQARFEKFPGVHRSGAITQVWPGRLLGWFLPIQSKAAPGATGMQLFVEALQDRVILIEVTSLLGGQPPENVVAELSGLPPIGPCARLTGWVGERLGVQPGEAEPALEESGRQCIWRARTGGLDAHIKLGEHEAVVSLSLVDSGRAEAEAEAEKELALRAFKASCGKCPSVQRGAQARLYSRVISVDLKRCSMTLRSIRPGGEGPGTAEVPCDASNYDRISEGMR